MNRDKEVVMLEDGRFMLQRKVYERKQHLLQNLPSSTIMTTPLNCEIIPRILTVNILLLLKFLIMDVSSLNFFARLSCQTCGLYICILFKVMGFC